MTKNRESPYIVIPAKAEIQLHWQRRKLDPDLRGGE